MSSTVSSSTPATDPASSPSCEAPPLSCDAPPPSEDDDSRPEATFSYTVENFSALKESVLSPPCVVRNLPWKIMIMPRQQQSQGQGQGQNKSLGFFLQCNGESEAASWSCQAAAELRIHTHLPEKEHFRRKISHLFYSKENDWGFSHFINWSDVIDPEKGYIKDDKVTFEVKVTADAPHGTCWDSKKHTGFVGLKNQGATCYMNSLLQVLYFTNIFRKSVYKIPTEADDGTKSLGLALQRVFHDLQFNEKWVGTKKLTKSFGWETMDSFMQHDVQEFLRVLLDKLETKMKGTCVEGTIPRLFEGKMESYIRCKNVDYTSTRQESYYDIQLNIKGKKDIYESFADYIKTENLDGDNKYAAGSYGLQDADKGVIFTSFPPILHLHLMRFQYDPVTDSSVKFNDRFEFPVELNLSEFLKDSSEVKEEDDEKMEVDGDHQVANGHGQNGNGQNGNGLINGQSKEDLTTYILHAVLVHSGDNHGGHYVVFIQPKGDGKWCKFDDDVVSRCTDKEAVTNNFGGVDEEVLARHSTNAYMLVYLRKSMMKDLLVDVKENDIPAVLVDRLTEEKRLEMVRRKEKMEAHLYMTIRILTEDDLSGHQGNDLYDQEKIRTRDIRVKKDSTVKEVMEKLSDITKYPVENLRLWPMSPRSNQTMRPSLMDYESDLMRSIHEAAEGANTLTAFLEMDTEKPLGSFDKDHDVMLFFKYYDPRVEKIHFMGHMYVPITEKVVNMLPEMCRRAHLPEDTNLLLYEEIKPNMLEKIDDLDKPLEHVLEELMDGDIIVFQREIGPEEKFRLPYSRDYFRDLFFRVEVNFVDKNNPNEPGFVLALSQRMNYPQLARVVANHLEENDPDKLQFFKTQNYKDAPGHAVRCTFEGNLRDLLFYNRTKQPKKLFYQRLSMPIQELEKKKSVKCNWLSLDQKEEKEMMLHPLKGGNVDDLLKEARAEVTLSRPEAKLRLLEISSHKITGLIDEFESLDRLPASTSKTLRIEEIPEDQENIADDERLVPVMHFNKEIFSTFGHPFFIKVKDGELMTTIADRIRQQFDISETEFDRDFRLSVIVLGRARFIDEETADNNADQEMGRVDKVNLQMFDSLQQQSSNGAKPYFGLQHTNKSNKRPRYNNYMEKAIKIYN